VKKIKGRSTNKRQQTKFKFICPIFRQEIMLILGDVKQLKNVPDLVNYEGLIAFCHTVLDKEETVDYFLVWVAEPTDYNSMVHETVHLVKRIFQAVNVPFNSDNDEIIAYYQNYWVRKFWNKMSEFIK